MTGFLGRANDALLVVLLINVGVLLPVALLAEFPNYGLTLRAVVFFAIAGLVGTLGGRAFYYVAIERIGASRSAPLKSTTPLFATIIAVILLGERPTPGNYVGIVLMVVGIAVVTWEANDDDAAGADRLLDFGIPLFSAFLFGIEPTFAKLGFAEGTPVFVGLILKTGAGALGVLAYLRWREGIPSLTALRGDRTSMKWYAFAGLSNTVFLLGYYFSLSVASVSIVSPIQQTSPLLIVGISAALLPQKEEVTWRVWVAAGLVVLGAIAITFFG